MDGRDEAGEYGWEERPRYRRLLAALDDVVDAAASLRQLLVNAGDLLHALLDAERVAVWAVDVRNQSLYSLARSGGETATLRLALDESSVPGFAATTGRTVCLRDVSDPAERARFSPRLRHDPARDVGAGNAAKQLLVAPMRGDAAVLGVIEFVNSLDGNDFQVDDIRLAEQIARMIGKKLDALTRPAPPAPRPPIPSAQPTSARPPPMTASAGPQSKAVQRLLDQIARNARDESADDDALVDDPGEGAREPEALAVRLVRQIVIDAEAARASDVHIEPGASGKPTKVRFRVDGDCADYVMIPGAFHDALVGRLKVLANLDLAERRRPQDGRLRVRGPAGPIEVRIATLPTVGEREDVTLRLLAGWRTVPLEGLHLSDANLRRFSSLIASPYGIVLVTGPTGSGKTTTLHAALGVLNTADRKVLTVEDPVEIVQPGLRQVQVNARIGLGFPEALRAFLRSDPDVIMVGEMRDRVTATIAVEASLTGHLVLSTLQANSAIETVPRLLGMDIDAYAFADALRGVVAQRLVRRLCERCRAPFAPTPEEWARLSRAYGEGDFARLADRSSMEFSLHRAAGCADCGGTGYKGRVAIHEILVGTDPVQDLIRHRGTIDEIRAAAAADGMTTMLQDGVEKVLRGLTDFDQVRAACV
ncbi:MAG: GspE/PulE family protein [Polyangiales bacterium]